jgi:O-antigen ligase
MNLILIQFEHLSKGKIISPIFILILLLIVFLLLYDFFADIFNLILAKTSKAGLLNSRDLEFKFIINSLSTDLKTFLFGMGWGSYIFSVGTSKFRYVHNIFLYFFAKSGLIGLLLLLYYLYLVFSNLFFGLKKYKKIFKYNVIYILISFLTFAFILEPCFKMFTTYLIIFVFMNTDLFFKVSAKTNQKDVVN